MLVFFVIFALRRVFRYEILAALFTAIMFTFLEGGFPPSDDWRIAGGLHITLYGILIFILLRIGLVALISAIYFLNGFNGILSGTDWKAWYTPSSLATLTLMFSLALFAFWRSLGNRELITGEESPA